jgi:hypothetical protein
VDTEKRLARRRRCRQVRGRFVEKASGSPFLIARSILDCRQVQGSPLPKDQSERST